LNIALERKSKNKPANSWVFVVEGGGETSFGRRVFVVFDGPASVRNNSALGIGSGSSWKFSMLFDRVAVGLFIPKVAVANARWRGTLSHTWGGTGSAWPPVGIGTSATTVQGGTLSHTWGGTGSAWPPVGIGTSATTVQGRQAGIKAAHQLQGKEALGSLGSQQCWSIRPKHCTTSLP
jgi:hypothetical protein